MTEMATVCRSSIRANDRWTRIAVIVLRKIRTAQKGRSATVTASDDSGTRSPAKALVAISYPSTPVAAEPICMRPTLLPDSTATGQHHRPTLNPRSRMPPHTNRTPVPTSENSQPYDI